MKRSLVLVVVGIISSVGSLLAEPRATEIGEVLALDRLRTERMMTGEALDALFSEELVFVHSDGRVEPKKAYIANLTAGDTAYADVKTSDMQARQITPDVIVLTGVQEMRKKLGPTWSEIKLCFMSVWRREGGTWRMVAWQSARPAGSSILPPR